MKLLLRLSVGLFVCLPMFIGCMEIGEYDYLKKCRKINKKDEKKLQEYIEGECRIDSIKAIQKIEDRLNRLRQEIDAKKEKVLLDFKNRYGFNDNDWNFYRYATTGLDTFLGQQKNTVLPNVKHDSAIPAGFLCMLKKRLQDNGINLKMVALESIEDDFAREYCIKMHWKPFVEEKDFAVEIHEPGYIGINAHTLKEFSQEEQEGVCVSLVSFMSSSYAFHKLEALLKGLQYSEQERAKAQIIYNPKSLQLLSCALKNQRNAKLLKAFYGKVEANDFSIDDYKKLSEIDRLYRVLAWFKEYVADGDVKNG